MKKIRKYTAVIGTDGDGYMRLELDSGEIISSVPFPSAANFAAFSCSQDIVYKRSTLYTIEESDYIAKPNVTVEPNDDKVIRPRRSEVPTTKTSVFKIMSEDKGDLGEIDELSIKDDHVSIQFKKPVKINIAEPVENITIGVTDFRAKKKDHADGDDKSKYFYFPNKIDEDDNLRLKIRTGNKFLRGAWKFSAITITARNRSRISNRANDYRRSNDLDTPKDTWETKISPGVAVTNELVKWTTFAKDMSSNSISLNYGGILSVGTQEISEKSTLGRITTSRKALSFTVGGIVGIDINKLDLGFFGGIELATGSGAKDWISQCVLLYGFILVYELKKLK